MVFQRVKRILPHLSLMIIFTIVMGCWVQALAAKPELREVNWESLDLSSQQRQHLQDLDDQWKSCVSELAPRIQMNEKKLKTLMKSPKPNTNEVLRLQQEIQDDKKRLKMEATQIFILKRKVLNQDQEQRLMQMMNLH